MRGDRVGVEIGCCRSSSAASVYGWCSHAVREPSAPSTNRSPASPRAPVRSIRSRAWPAVVTRFAPVADDLDAVVGVAQRRCQSSMTADVGACAFVHRDDAERGRGVEGGQPRFAALLGGQPVAGGRAHQVVGVAGQRPLRIEARRVGQTRRQPAQRGRGRRGVDIDAGKVGGPVADDSVEVVGAGRRASRASRIRPSHVPRSGRRDARARNRR